MAKKQKKNIKTSRYWTRTCENCGFEFPNWFVQCPRCKQTWNAPKEEFKPTPNNIEAKPLIPQKEKTVRIIAQIAEDEAKINMLTIFFSGDNGISWFQMPMQREHDYFVAEILNVPINSTIIYYLKGIDETGEEFLEDNNQEFYYYYVVDDIAKESEYEDLTLPNGAEYDDTEGQTPIEDQIDEPIAIEAPNFNQNNHNQSAQQYAAGSGQGVTFTPLNQARKDENLRQCPNCKSKVKKDWAACPICGYKF